MKHLLTDLNRSNGIMFEKKNSIYSNGIDLFNQNFMKMRQLTANIQKSVLKWNGIQYQAPVLF